MITIEGSNKIQEIKNIRQYCVDRYGVTCGLKQSKDLIDNVQEIQGAKALKEQKLASMSLELLQSLKNALSGLYACKYGGVWTAYESQQCEQLSETIRKADAALAEF